MQKLNTIQKRANLNEVHRLGDPGPGGAYHEYMVVSAEGQNILEHIQFQKGPRAAQDSVPGILECDLLEIVRDRLRSFQAGPMSCNENARALMYVEQALIQMNIRVENRIERGVLGTMEK